MPPPTSRRRSGPQQERSRATVERILAAAEAEIAEVGLARTSTRRIADRAGVSVGATYRFFADKEAIAVALAARYLAAAEAAYAPVLAQVSATGLAVAVRDLVSAAAVLQRDFPGYYRLTEEQLPASTTSPAHATREQLVDLFAAALIEVDPTLGPERARVRVELCVETVRHVLARLEDHPPEARGLVVRELATMLTGFLGASPPAPGNGP